MIPEGLRNTGYVTSCNVIEKQGLILNSAAARTDPLREPFRCACLLSSDLSHLLPAGADRKVVDGSVVIPAGSADLAETGGLSRDWDQVIFLAPLKTLAEIRSPEAGGLGPGDSEGSGQRRRHRRLR